MRDAVAQVEDRGYPVRKVAERLGVSTKSIYPWQKQFLNKGRHVRLTAIDGNHLIANAIQ